MGNNEMKKIILLLLCYVSVSCTNNRDIYQIIYTECLQQKEQDFVFDFSEFMNFDWDTMCVYSGKCSLDMIEKDLGRAYSNFKDIGMHIIFLKDKYIVYSQAWYSIYYKNTKWIYFDSLEYKLKFHRNDTKFLVSKNDDMFTLHHIKK